jgi:MYXO-CTERM domain-containing protein
MQQLSKPEVQAGAAAAGAVVVALAAVSIWARRRRHG